MPKKIRLIALALSLALLAAGAAQALPRDGRPAGQEPGLLTAVWSWFTTLIAPAGPDGASRMTAAWGEEGGMMDPDGQPTAGPEMDPNGTSQTTTTSPTDAGGMMDPNG